MQNTQLINHFYSDEKIQAMNDRQKIISRIELICNGIFQEFGERIDSRKDHYSHTVSGTVIELLNELSIFKDCYLHRLGNINKDINESTHIFIGQCQSSINAAMPILESDFNWSDYLSNLLKSIANAIFWVISFGKCNNFFTPIRSELAKSAVKLEFAIEGMDNM